MIHVFTAAAPNYIGKVRTLFHSVREHHPEFVLHLVLADIEGDSIDLGDEPFDDIVLATELLEESHPGWLFSHNLVELSTAIKGAAALRLLTEKEADLVLYFDPDMVLFSRLDDLLKTLESSSAVLTPHLTEPEETTDAILDNEICALRHGVFNLGFLGVRDCSEGRKLIRWWRDRLAQFCRADIDSGLFTDQRWMDLAPCFLSQLAILRDPRFNVAPWNIGRRELTGTFDEGFRVDGRPLGFYHFSGFDSGAHEAMTNKYAPGNRSVSMLTEWYRRRTEILGGELQHQPWRLGHFDDGDPITDLQRRIYRERPDLQQAFPDPFMAGTNGDSYRSWFQTQAAAEYPELFAQ